jgi:hypothetical protein
MKLKKTIINRVVAVVVVVWVYLSHLLHHPPVPQMDSLQTILRIALLLIVNRINTDTVAAIVVVTIPQIANNNIASHRIRKNPLQVVAVAIRFRALIRYPQRYEN